MPLYQSLSVLSARPFRVPSHRRRHRRRRILSSGSGAPQRPRGPKVSRPPWGPCGFRGPYRSPRRSFCWTPPLKRRRSPRGARCCSGVPRRPRRGPAGVVRGWRVAGVAGLPTTPADPGEALGSPAAAGSLRRLRIPRVSGIPRFPGATGIPRFPEATGIPGSPGSRGSRWALRARQKRAISC